MRAFAFICMALVLGAAAQADDLLPDRHETVFPNTDFFGSDLRFERDVTFEACRKACAGDDECRALTYNTRAAACFLKSGVGEHTPFNGATSVNSRPVSAAARALAARRAEAAGFLKSADLAAALRQAETLADRHPRGTLAVEELLRASADMRQSINLAAAIRYAGEALAATDAPEVWVDYAGLHSMLAAATRSQRRRNYGEALAAAVNGYLRAGADPLAATAAQEAAIALEALGRGRDAIGALRLAQALAPREDTAVALDAAIAKYGFRVIEHQVDSDTAEPRICATFSEPLVEAGVDYAPFVSLEETGLAVSVEGAQLCIDGVEHGARYRVTFRPGLPAATGETLARQVTLSLYVRDRSPSVRFPGRAYVLPAGGPVAIPLVGVNAPEAELTLYRISDRNVVRAIQEDLFGRPLSEWEERGFRRAMATEVWSGTGELGTELNRDVTTRLPLDDVLSGLRPGVYALQARIPGADPYDFPAAMQWFVVSDLGLTTLSGSDGLTVAVRGLNDAAPAAGVALELVSRANSVLGEAETGSDGIARFPPGLMRGKGSAAPALLTARRGDDIAFLPLTDPEFDLSDRGVEGRAPGGPVDVFLATDRGAYRAGETIHATALARDPAVRAIDGLPLVAVLERPDGVEYSRALSATDRAGGHVFALPVDASAPRGTYRLSVFADPDAEALATKAVLVEDFLPERIDVTLGLPDGPLPGNAAPELSIEARYLYGAPAGDLPAEIQVRLTPSRSLPGFERVRFGRHDVAAGRQGRFADPVRTAADGTARTTLQLPEPEVRDRPHQLEVIVSVTEGSGRPVERTISRTVAPGAPMIGIRPASEDILPEGAEARFELIALGPDLGAIEMPVRWTLNRVERRYQWYSLYGSWNWEPVTIRTRVASGEALLGAGPVAVAAPVDWGTYELRVDRVGGEPVSASYEFAAGWYGAVDASSTPDMLDVALDREGYAAGDTARLRIDTPEGGQALVTVAADRLIDLRLVEVPAGGTTVSFPVTDDWGAGAYVAAHLVRPADRAQRLNPTRALGLAHAGVAPGDRRIEAAFDVPTAVRPRGPLEVRLEVGQADGPVYATIAAVDVGILNLTGFDSPDPAGHYFGQRRLGVGIRDLYGRLIDGMAGAMGRVRSGGDGPSQMRLQSPPPTEDLVAYFTGPLVAENGQIRTSFDLPAFNGTVRLMAVVWSDRGIGQAEAEVLVRDPVVVSASLPRFLAPGDSAALRLELTHAEGPEGTGSLTLAARGVDLGAPAGPQPVDIAAGRPLVLRLPLAARDVGDHEITVTLETPGGETLARTLTVPVRRNDPEIGRRTRFALDPGATFTLDDNLFAEFQPGTGRATVAAGPVARLDAPGLLLALDRYPYGCTEQITSRAMPLLYLSSVAQALELDTRADLDTRIAQAITAVLGNQTASGSFGLWRPVSGDFWLDAYVTDFLARARAEGHAVPEAAFRSALDNLRNRVNYAPDFEHGGEDIAYALHVLAREGAAAVGDLRYYADVKAEALATPLALAQLGAALAAYGDSLRADRLFRRAAQRLREAPESSGWRADYGTGLRDGAAVLTLAAEAGSDAIDRDALVARIAAGAGTSRRSTQEATWSLLAVRALMDGPRGSTLTVNGAPVDGPLVRVLGDEARAAPLRIANTGATTTDLTVSSFGVPRVAPEAGGRNFTLERRYFTLDGTPVEPDRVRLGTRLVALLTVQPWTRADGRLMVEDPLPAGFEIDNPGLMRSGDVEALEWLGVTSEVANAEFLSDRFRAAVDWRSDKALRLAYIVRAVSAGDFHHPAAQVEDMYRPDDRAWTGAGRVVVQE